MATTSSNKKRLQRQGDPTVSRPYIADPIYGVPRHNKGLLPWSHVSDRMAQAKVYWVSTVSPDGRPHATPVDGIWLDERLYFGGSAKTRRHRNLAANPAACIHLESASDVIILHGDVQELRNPDHNLAVRLAEASNEKYGYGAKPEDYEKDTTGQTWVFHPRVVIAWKPLMKDATRWIFAQEDEA